ncbi:MAG: D-tyrosyl-tRNA(Tyr) deacylase [Acidobacteria bacterium]|nr:D-tyrosyl-tRNA(Tyr) deacylase [Acidobacteriota bacterium]
MRALLQRVSQASVHVDQQKIAQIGAGYLILIGVGASDSADQAQQLAEKIVHMRLFPDELGRFHHSLLETGGAALVVSQFTLFADTRKGRRPSFTDAARPELAEPLVQTFGKALQTLGVSDVQFGQFGAHMDVSLHNDGPVTIWLDTD